MNSKISTLKKELWKSFLFLRGKFQSDKHNRLSNLYLLTMQKSGSQWIKKVLGDERLKEKTNLIVYPQHRYEWNEFKQKFPKGTFIPGLYMSYDLYEEIQKPKNYKTICIIRDPRDIVVSWYFSMLKTHKLMGKVGRYRAELTKMDIDSGLHYCIEELATKFIAMRSWINNKEDENMLIVNFEDLIENPNETFSKIFNWCSVDLDEGTIKEIIDDYSKEKMRKEDLKKREDKSESHYRSKSSKHNDYFKKNHYKHFYDVTGNLIDVLGYER